MLRVGSRAQVMHGNAKQTSGGLMKKDLKYNKHGKIVSKKMSQIAKKEKRLENAGYITQKGVFGAQKKNIKGGVNFQLLRISQGQSKRSINDNDAKQSAIVSIESRIHKFSNVNRSVIQTFLIGLENKTIKRLARSGSFNPNNEIYIDKINKKVYKFGLWKDSERSIRNEFIAYSLLNATNNNSDKKHFPKLYDCILIPDTKYALLVIEYKYNLIQFKLNNESNNNKQTLYNETVAFLKGKGMVNRDLIGNLYYYLDADNKKIFYCIDFEEVEFINSSNKKIPVETQEKITKYNNLVNIVINNKKSSKRRKNNSSFFNGLPTGSLFGNN